MRAAEAELDDEAYDNNMKRQVSIEECMPGEVPAGQQAAPPVTAQPQPGSVPNGQAPAAGSVTDGGEAASPADASGYVPTVRD